MTGYTGHPHREFGRRKEPHRVIIARGDTVRSFTVSPWLAGAGVVVGLALAIGYIGATAYLVLRDDIIQVSAERQAEMQLSYEDRISALRARIDQLTSRRVLEKRTIEEQLEEVIARQQEIDDRQADVARLIARAAESGIRVAVASPLPPAKPDIDATGSLAELGGDDGAETVAAPALGGTAEPIEISPVLSLRGTRSEHDDPAAAAAAAQATGGLPLSPRRLAPARDAAAPAPAPAALAPPADAPAAETRPATAREPDKRAQILQDLTLALARIDGETTVALDVIAASAERDARTITGAAERLGLRLAGAPAAPAGLGGPFVPLGEVDFGSRLDRAEAALDHLDAVRIAARGVPFARPVAGAATSSGFGPRLDPFLGRMAMHTGIDFRAPTGTAIRAPAPGRVVFAGRNAGYGKSVEIEHPSGLVTRFAHMSRIAVEEGDHVKAGEILGQVGSTGRSTGPHLHYEIRQGDRPLDPLPFLRAGESLAALLTR